MSLTDNTSSNKVFVKVKGSNSGSAKIAIENPPAMEISLTPRAVAVRHRVKLFEEFLMLMELELAKDPENSAQIIKQVKDTMERLQLEDYVNNEYDKSTLDSKTMQLIKSSIETYKYFVENRSVHNLINQLSL